MKKICGILPFLFDFLKQKLYNIIWSILHWHKGALNYAEKEVKRGIDDFERKLKDEINAGIKTYFNTATRQILTDNVVSMLMCNDTYKKLSDSMQTFLPKNEG